jgi:hypothetical protein
MELRFRQKKRYVASVYSGDKLIHPDQFVRRVNESCLEYFDKNLSDMLVASPGPLTFNVTQYDCCGVPLESWVMNAKKVRTELIRMGDEFLADLIKVHLLGDAVPDIKKLSNGELLYQYEQNIKTHHYDPCDYGREYIIYDTSDLKEEILRRIEIGDHFLSE